VVVTASLQTIAKCSSAFLKISINEKRIVYATYVKFETN